MLSIPRQPLSLADSVLKQICVDHKNLEKLQTQIKHLNIPYTVKQQITRVQASFADFDQQFKFILSEILPQTMIYSALHIQDAVVLADLTFLNLYNKELISLYMFHLSTVACGNELLFNATKHTKHMSIQLNVEIESQRQERDLKAVSNAMKQLELLDSRSDMTYSLLFLSMSTKSFMHYGWLDGVRFLIQVIRKRKDKLKRETVKQVINIIFKSAMQEGQKCIRVFDSKAGDLAEELLWHPLHFELMRPYFETLRRRELERHVEMLKSKANEPEIMKKLEDLERFLAER